MASAPPLRTYSCQREMVRPTISRAVITTWTSRPGNESRARCTCGGDAGPKNSWLIRTSPSQADDSATRSSHGAETSPPRCARRGLSRRSRVASRCRLRCRPGSSRPASPRTSLLCHSARWRYVVPVLGRPMWRKTWPVDGPLVTRPPPQRLAHVCPVAGQDRLHLLLVTVGDRQQELHHHVAELGEPQVDLPALLDLGLELGETVAEPDHGAVALRPLLHPSHVTTHLRIAGVDRASGAPIGCSCSSSARSSSTLPPSAVTWPRSRSRSRRGTSAVSVGPRRVARSWR